MKIPPSEVPSKKCELVSTDLGYNVKRVKDNDTVKKSRGKTRQKSKRTMKEVSQLEQENETLEERIK